KKSQELKENSEKIENVFIKVIYSKNGKVFKDLHIFKHGLVLFEEFGRKNGELLSAKITQIEETKELFNLLTEEYFYSQNSLTGCREKGFLSSYVEVQLGEQNSIIQTCGINDSQASRIFNKALELYE
ncbi:MAG: hypothetical protein Q7K42_01015, partial [Candidatus Diapherotrites archaeon]|nr:hypothetical protein [Candidatus Diapherotrites archaeon]